MVTWPDGGQPIGFVRFRMPTARNLVPIRIDVEIEGRRFRDAFCWEADEPDGEIHTFTRRLVEEEKLPGSFVSQISQSIQSQLADFRFYEGQELSTQEKVLPIKLDLRVNRFYIHDQFLWDAGNMDSDPEGFALQLCQDLRIDDPQVAPAIAIAIREQLLEIAKQSVSGAGRESRLSKKPRRSTGGLETTFRQGTTAAALMRRPNNRLNVLRRPAELESYEPVVEVLTEQEVEALEQKEDRNARLKRRQEEGLDTFGGRYSRQ